MRTAQSMYDLLYHPDPGLRQAVVRDLVNQGGDGMLLILDGYDELSDSQREVNSVFQQLMSRRLLCQATLMVTSRPIATRTLHPNFHQSIDQHIEVLGFSEKDIDQYISSVCRDKPALVSDFVVLVLSSSLMYIPLQCAVMTDLYCSHWEGGNKGFTPKKLTELYTGLIYTLLLRYFTDHPRHSQRDWLIELRVE